MSFFVPWQPMIEIESPLSSETNKTKRKSSENSIEESTFDSRIQTPRNLDSYGFFLHRLYLRLLAEIPRSRYDLLINESLFSGPIHVKYVVVFLWKCRNKENFEAFFLDFESKEWIGLRRSEDVFSQKELQDLLFDMKKFEKNTVFMLFSEFLLFGMAEIQDLKGEMTKNCLCFVDFSKDIDSNDIMKENGLSSMKTESLEFPRIFSNAQFKGGFLMDGKRDFQMEEIRIIVNRILRIRRSLKKVKNEEIRGFLTVGLGNYHNLRRKDIKFRGFLEAIKKMCRRRKNP